MEAYFCERTIKSPAVSGNPETGEILIQGRSYPESAIEFYRPFKEWLDQLFATSPAKINFIMDMEYFNTSTAGVLFEIIGHIANQREKTEVQIVWKYEADDVDMKNKGQSLKDHFGEIIQIEENPEEAV